MNKICFFLLLIIISLSCKKENNTEKPNIVLILTDDQGWGDLSANGNLSLNTPNIDRIAEQGVTFDRFYVCPVCSPTRAELLTGRYHLRGGVYDVQEGGERLNIDETTIGDIFKNAGYATAAYGKWHNGTQAPYHPNCRGFDDFYGFCSGHWGNYFSPMLEHNGEIVKGNGFIIDDLTDHGLQFIEQNKDKPFFLYLPYNTPHAPMQVPDKWWNKFENADITQFGTDSAKENIQHTKASLAMCENIDWNVGRVISKLEELGLEENTIVLYLSDNGPNGNRWNGGMKGIKGSTDEGGVRSPLFIQWKNKLPKGKTIAEISGAIDILPTLVELAEIENISAKPFDGLSLKPLLASKNKEWPDRYIFSYWNNKSSLRNQKFQLDNLNRLFDMENDPEQTSNVSDKHPAVTAEMKQRKQALESQLKKRIDFENKRPFTVGGDRLQNTLLPARDAIVSGNIVRSNIWPNCSFYTNWININDKITWQIEILTEGDYDVELYYTCPAGDVGSKLSLKFKENEVVGMITEANDPPLKGMENDRVQRTNSYVKDFKPLQMGKIHLKKGLGVLELKATEIPGEQVMDFRLLVLKRL